MGGGWEAVGDARLVQEARDVQAGRYTDCGSAVLGASVVQRQETGCSPPGVCIRLSSRWWVESAIARYAPAAGTAAHARKHCSQSLNSGKGRAGNAGGRSTDRFKTRGDSSPTGLELTARVWQWSRQGGQLAGEHREERRDERYRVLREGRRRGREKPRGRKPKAQRPPLPPSLYIILTPPTPHSPHTAACRWCSMGEVGVV